MKPNFALNLSHDGIGLFHRTKGGGKAGWTLIDEVPLDDPDFADKLKLLRKKAADLEKGGLATKLIIPNSQILYTEVEAPGPDDISREVQIRDALEGLTPYEVGQLVFDWRKTKTTKVKVAVVARETLTEAEQFAKEHRFNPVSFVARPKGKGFRGEAFFGKSAGASALLGPGEKVEPDKSPVPDIETPKPAQDSKADNKPADGGETPTSPKTDTEVQAVDTPGQDSPETAETDTQPAADKGPEGVAFTSTSEIPVSSEEEDKRIAALLAEVPDPLDKSGSDQDDEDLSELQGEAPEADVAKAEKPASKPKSRAAGKPEPPVLAPFPPTPEEDDLPVPIMPAPPPPPRRQLPPSVAASLDKAASAKASKPVSQAPAKSAEAAKPALAKPAPPTKTKSEPVPAFSSRRVGPANEPAPASPASNGQATRKPLASPAVPPVAAPATPPLSSKPNGATAPTAPAIDSPKSADATSQPPLSHAPKVASVANPVLPKDDLPKSNGDAAAKAGIFNRSTQGLRKRAAAKTPAAAPEGAPRSTFNRLTFGPGAKADGASAKPVGKAVPIAPPPAGTAGVEGGSEAEKLTMFGARSSQTREVGGKPKYLGLMLILALLLIMAVVALASVFLFSDDTASGPEQAAGNEFSAAAIPDPALTSPIAEQPLTGQSAPGPEIVASVPGQPVLPDSESLGSIDTDLLADQEPEPEVLDTDTVAETPAVPGLPQQAEILSDDAAEARYAATGIWQKAPVVPNEPPGNRIDDLYVASIDPAITGHDAIALPPASPATRDERPATPPPPPPPGTEFAFNDRGLVTPTPSGALSPDGHLVFLGQPPVVAPLRPSVTPTPEITAPNPLAGFRPKPRPTGLVESTERVNLGGVTRSELASIRPKARPPSFQDAAQAAVAEAAVAIAAEAAVAEAAVAANAPNELAVASSPTPGYRPGNFSRIVEAARANANASDGSTVVSASAAATVVPAIPTRASVATQATINNAIRLNRINLIGIYGSASSRRALVRMKNGRYVKVQVGDSLDGGKVISITANRLVYKKGGRTKTLELLPLG